jgi:hypothetical protein
MTREQQAHWLKLDPVNRTRYVKFLHRWWSHWARVDQYMRGKE